MKLFYFSNLTGSIAGWAKNPDHFREVFKVPASACTVIRANHADVEPPPGYVKTTTPFGPVVHARRQKKGPSFLTSFGKLVDPPE